MLKLLANGGQINNFLRRTSLILYYSTAKDSLQDPLNPLADYLVKSLGFSLEAAVAASNKLSHLKSPEKPIAVINFLKQNGFEQSQIKTILSYEPRLLACRDIETLCPRIRVFQELGLSDSDIGSVLAANPSVLRRSAGTHLKPLIECLRSVLGSDEVVTKAIQRNTMLLNCSVARLESNLSLLKSYGVSGEKLVSLVLYNPWHLICQTEVLEKNMKDVETLFEIPREASMFLHGMFVFSSLSRDTMESKRRVFRSYGWSEEEIRKLVRKLPGCLRLSESKIKVGLDYYMKELNYEAAFIATYPSLLNFSLKNRVLPRRAFWKALIEKDLITTKVSFCYFVYMPEHRFLDYIRPFKNHLPNLFESYMIKSSSSFVTIAK